MDENLTEKEQIENLEDRVEDNPDEEANYLALIYRYSENDEKEKLDAILGTNETIAQDNKKVAFDAWVRQRYKRLEADVARQQELRERIHLVKKATRNKA